MSLAKMYCKEIIAQLDRIPVYLPGRTVKPGDIISFGSGFFSPRPLGEFSHISTLGNLQIPFQIVNDGDADTYKYASRGSVGISFKADANGGPQAKGQMDISFSKEGATYLAAVGCVESYISNLADLEALLAPHKDKLDWKDCFIVTSVTVAQKALIMQSSSSNASLTLSGEVESLQIASSNGISASASVGISAYKDASFIKEWSENVPVFFSLARYKRKVFGEGSLDTKRIHSLTKSSNSFSLNLMEPSTILVEEEAQAFG